MEDYSEHGSISKISVKRFEKLNQLREANELCDVTLIAEGRRLKAHRNVLSAGSPYFWKMFTSSMLETNLEEISIPDINYETMEQIIQFLYTSRVRLTTETAQNILIAANFLEMLDLVEICGIYCVRLIDMTNCFSMRELFKTTNCDEKIMERANDYINRNLPQLTENESFLQLDINSVVEFLSDNELCCKSEEDVVRAGIRWLNANRDRKRFAQQIYNCIRFQLLSVNFKLEYIDNNPLFHNDVINRNIGPSNTPRKLKTSLVALNQAGQHSLQTYDSSAKQWKKLINVETKRYRHIAADSDFLILSGWDDESTDILFIDLFNLKTKQWKSLPSLIRPGHRNIIAEMYIVGCELYVFGRSYGNGTYSGHMFIYNMESENWMQDLQSIRLPASRQFVVLGKCIYMFEQGGNYNTNVRKFDTETKLWADVGLVEQKQHAQITAYKGKIYFSEANLRGVGRTRIFNIYDPVTNELKTLAPVWDSHAFCLEATSDGIYALRGVLTVNDKHLREVDYYDVENNEWRFELKFPDEWDITMLTSIPDMYSPYNSNYKPICDKHRTCHIMRFIPQKRLFDICVSQWVPNIWSIAEKGNCRIQPRSSQMTTMDDFTEHGSKSTLYVERFSVFDSLRKANQLCDVTLVVQDKRLRAHKNVLSAGSPYFLKMFTSPLLESNSDEISIPGMKYKTMEQVIEFLYTSRIRISTENAQDILLAANFLQIDSLVDLCGKYIVKWIDEKNCFPMRDLLVSTNSDNKLIASANEYINRNLAQISHNESFLQLDIDSVVELLSSDELCCVSEEDVVRGALRWMNVNNYRRSYAQQLFNCIRLLLLSEDFKSEFIDNNPLFSTLTSDENIGLSNTSRTLKTSLLALHQSGQKRSLHTYDSSAKKWTKLMKIEEKTYKFIAADSEYLVLAGQESDGNQNFFFDLFDFKTKNWKSLPSLQNENQSRLPCEMIMVGCRVYFFRTGIRRRALTYLIQVSIYDIEKEAWINGVEMISPCFTPNFVAVGKFIYLFEKIGDETKIRKLDTDTQVREDGILMNHQDCSKLMTTYRGKIYFEGSSGKGAGDNSNFNVYDPVTNERKKLAPMKESNVFRLVATSDGIYALSRHSLGNDMVRREIDFYDVENDEWQYGANVPDGLRTELFAVVPSFYCRK